MRTIEVAADRRLVEVDHATPEPGPGQVRLDVAYCGICGSDLHFRDVPELFPAGTVPGHELSGRIAVLGPEVDGWTVGDRVCVLPFAQCGECELCRSGNEQVCPHAVANGVGLGTGRPGAYADAVIVDQRMLFALPDEVDDRAGALVEPLAVAVRAVAQAAVPVDQPVLVLGGGPIGLLTALVLRERGYERAVLVSRNAARARLAESLGLRTAAADDVEPPVAVFECAGTPAAARQAVELLRPLGVVMLVGLSLEPLELPAPPVVINELQIRGVITYRRREFAEAIELLAARRIPADRVITGTVPLSQAEEAFRTLTRPGHAHVKVLLAP
ncbi:MAG: alcohol dehydrogenase catalytic domain-containing protein [Solirubrobacterales bacterium]|nr:alcohol dehydrogenase catalytic domain-containing protein [Solirubrobacterales bacterium]MBV9716909.1 alcohol dehydrogenase catalytic domain-containing protein [Solirubrobacterales bacterium]